MRVLPVCALLVVSAIATQTQPATKVAPNEDGKDAKGNKNNSEPHGFNLLIFKFYCKAETSDNFYFYLTGW